MLFTFSPSLYLIRRKCLLLKDPTATSELAEAGFGPEISFREESKRERDGTRAARDHMEASSSSSASGDLEGGTRRWLSLDGRRRSRSLKRSGDSDSRTIANGDVPDAGWPRHSYQGLQEQDLALYSYIVEQQHIALEQQYVYDAKAEMQLGKKSFGALCFTLFFASSVSYHVSRPKSRFGQ